MSIRSPAGAYRRAELYSTDSEGNPIKHRPRGLCEVLVRETQPTPDVDKDIIDVIQGARVMARLTEAERQALKLYEESSRLGKEQILTCSAGERFRHFGRGYRFVRSLPAREQPDGTVIEEVQLAGRERSPVSWEMLGQRLGVSAAAAKRACSRAYRKLGMRLR